MQHGASARPETWSVRTAEGAWVEATTRADGALFDLFYRGYDQSFTLPNEKEERDGFVACLSLNAGVDFERLQARYGDFREVVSVTWDSQGGSPVGGTNFIASPLDQGRKLALNLNYLYVLAAQRRRGHFRRVLDGVAQIARAMFNMPASIETWIFIEQNDPLRMEAADYARDTAHSGLDQIDRLEIWAKLGARIVDFPYVQPALSSAQAPDDTLLYSVLGVSGPRVPVQCLHAHLERFFGISVLKGAALEASPAAHAQLAALDQMAAGGEEIALLDPMPAIAALRQGPLSGALSKISSTRALARALQGADRPM